MTEPGQKNRETPAPRTTAKDAVVREGTIANPETGASPADANASYLDTLISKLPSSVRGVMGGFSAENFTYNAMTSDSVSNSVMRNNNAVDNGMGGSGGKTDKEKEEARKFREMLDQMRAWQAQIDDINRHIDANNQKIADIDKKIENLQAFSDRLEGHIAGLVRGEIPPKDADGSFKDKEFERKIREYEERTGQKVDRNDAKTLLAVSGEIQKAAKDDLQKFLDERKKLTDDNEVQEDKKNKIEKKMEKTASDNPEVGKAFFAETRLNQVKNPEKSAELALETNKANAVVKQYSESTFDDINDLNDVVLASNADSKNDNAIALNKSAASQIDGGSTESIRGSFAMAHGAVVNPDAIQVAELTVKDNSPVPKNIV